MRRQLVGMVIATTSIVLIALLLPMAALIQRFALEDALAAASLEVQATESVVTLQDRADLVAFIEILNDNDDGARTTVLFADGDAIGPDQQVNPDVVEARDSGRAITNSTAEGVEILVPVTVGLAAFDVPDADEPPDNTVAVIRVVISHSQLGSEVVLSWAIIGLLGLGLLGAAVAVADRLARTLVRSVTGLAHTAERLGAGQLDARADPRGPPEIREVGQALNRLATRISELLAAERESAADLAHRLRTPLTALRLVAEDLSDPEERSRIGGGVDTLARYVDELITEARRPEREGLGASCDAAGIVRARTAFWSVLAEDQGRTAAVRVPDGPILVKVAAADFQAAVDVLLENVFSHTDEGTGFDVTLVMSAGGGAVLTVADRGAGFPAGVTVTRGQSGSGSTGLGIDIARRTAEASGGHLVAAARRGGGASIRMTLGPPNT